MSDTDFPEPVLLTEAEIELLEDPAGAAEADRAAMVEDLPERFWSTIREMTLLYWTLSDEELSRLFEGPGELLHAARTPSQDLLTMLYYGLQLTGDDVGYRLSSAIEAAEAARDRSAEVTLDIVTQPFLSPEQQIEAIEQGRLDQLSPMAFERLFYDDRVPAGLAVEALALSEDDELTAETLREERERFQHVERVPMAVIVDVVREPHEPAREQR